MTLVGSEICIVSSLKVFALQPVEVQIDDSPQKQVPIRQPLSPVNARLKNRVMQKSPFQKSSPPSALPATAGIRSPTASPENQIPQPLHWALSPTLAAEVCALFFTLNFFCFSKSKEPNLLEPVVPPRVNNHVKKRF